MHAAARVEINLRSIDLEDWDEVPFHVSFSVALN